MRYPKGRFPSNLQQGRFHTKKTHTSLFHLGRSKYFNVLKMCCFKHEVPNIHIILIQILQFSVVRKVFCCHVPNSAFIFGGVEPNLFHSVAGCQTCIVDLKKKPLIAMQIAASAFGCFQKYWDPKMDGF